MSWTTKKCDVSKNQTYSGKVDIRFYDDKLYICTIESDGTIQNGAELTLDPLPAAAIYGDSGTPIAQVLASIVELNLEASQITTEVEDAFRAAILAGLPTMDAIVNIRAII